MCSALLVRLHEVFPIDCLHYPEKSVNYYAESRSCRFQMNSSVDADVFLATVIICPSCVPEIIFHTLGIIPACSTCALELRSINSLDQQVGGELEYLQAKLVPFL